MKLIECLGCVYEQLLVNESLANLNVEHLCVDSREVTEASVFIALKGYGRNGVEFVADAINSGCAAVLLDEQELTKVTGLGRKLWSTWRYC